MEHIPRREALKTFGVAGAGALLGLGQRELTAGADGSLDGSANAGPADDAGGAAQADRLIVAGRPVRIAADAISARTIRISVLPLDRMATSAIRLDGSLVRGSWDKFTGAGAGARARGAAAVGAPAPERAPSPPTPSPKGEGAIGRPLAVGARDGDGAGAGTAAGAGPTATISRDPLTISVADAGGRIVQRLRIDEQTGAVTFSLGDAPVLGFGEGGPQFDRRGMTDTMRSGQGAYHLRTHGGRVPVPWLIGTSGWALFVHQPFGSFDLNGANGAEGRFTPGRPTGPGGGAEPADALAALPLDLFLVCSQDPREIMAEWARLTGLPELPPLWTLGYQQSHRTLGSREEVMEIATTFREKKLPCDAVIYLSTGFAPSGWNTANGSFAFNRKIFTDPKGLIDDLHAQHMRVVLHAVILSDRLRGAAGDRCDLASYDEEQAGCYWQTHRKVFALGVDGWWPDEGDPLDIASRLARNRMYWEGPQLDRPNERPYALHRNGYAGMQRYASFLWSGDPWSTWETLRTHVPIAINTGLTGIPYWGTDIGGFVPTKELTGELYVRWFQFGAFCPLFRSHGRTWRLRLPFGWNTGDVGHNEVAATYGNQAGNPDPSELHNAAVEPICRKYLELRYQLLPYLYSLVYEGHRTGLPIMRALWLHHADDAAAVARGDQYLWGRDILVAPVTEKGATTRTLYLPRGRWYDFWTNEVVEAGAAAGVGAGGREITRPVDLETLPLYVRAGAILPTGPVKQYTDEQVDGPLTLTIYPGADGSFLIYEDDGKSFDHRKGAWTGIELTWQDASRRLTARLAPGSRMLTPRRRLAVRLAGASAQPTKDAVFDGRELIVTL
jgi:alpha-glucosidase/alpha-D-xyloside xylohydrolase